MLKLSLKRMIFLTRNINNPDCHLSKRFCSCFAIKLIASVTITKVYLILYLEYFNYLECCDPHFSTLLYESPTIHHNSRQNKETLFKCFSQLSGFVLTKPNFANFRYPSSWLIKLRCRKKQIIFFFSSAGKKSTVLFSESDLSSESKTTTLVFYRSSHADTIFSSCFIVR